MGEAAVTLASRLQDGPLADREVAAIIDDVFVELTALHERGEVDRALSAERVLVNAGRGRLTERPAHVNEAPLGSSASVPRFPFMAPEEVCGSQAIDTRADTYAMGALAFVALTGKLPLRRASGGAQKVDRRPPTLASVAGRPFPMLLELFVATAMSPDPKRRYANARVAHAAWRIASSP